MTFIYSRIDSFSLPTGIWGLGVDQLVLAIPYIDFRLIPLFFVIFLTPPSTMPDVLSAPNVSDPVSSENTSLISWKQKE